MRVRAGTSGFSYKEWKGPFYPEKLPQRRFLEYYAEQLATVEINNTFYRMPKEEMLAGWCEQVPADFSFVLKASQRITHKSKLVDAKDSVDYLWEASSALGARRGPILFQLPPWLRMDLDVLRRFLDELPEGCRAAFEFRHESWQDDAVHEALREHGQTLCQADVEAKEDDAGPIPPPLIETADWGYLRLRRADYDDAALDAWAEAVRARGWSEAWVFFKHEDAGTGPRWAMQFAERFGGRQAPDA